MKKEINLFWILAAVVLIVALVCAVLAIAGGGDADPVPEDTQLSHTETEVPTEPGRIEKTPVELAELTNAATVTVTTPSGLGSGFFIDDNGTLVTCYHVIDGVNEITVTLSDGGVYVAESVIDFNDAFDIAVLKIAITGNPYLKISEDKIRQGENVYATGSALGFLNGTFSDGVISKTSRVIGAVNYIQTTAAISSGNSGGPMVNVYGEVVGICAAKYTSGENLNLAISVDMLDKMSMDKNWSISKYNEWYEKEIRRSYLIYNKTDEEFEYSLINTYHHITGRECYASDKNWDALYGNSYTIVTGYHDDYGIYYYEYDVKEFDQYTDYLLECGYEFISSEEFDVGTSYYYGNEFTNVYFDIFVTEDQEYIAFSPFCY